MDVAQFQDVIRNLPTQPGIYKYYDADHQLIYVGKAKNLKKRVSSYFTKTFTGYKTHELVKRIRKIEFTIVDNEQDAFLLENSLIKEFQPKFNINLKDDKTYPYLVIKHEPFPRVFLTRTKINDGSQYLGPFTSVGRVRELLVFIKQNIQLRTCTLNLTQENIRKKKFKVCLEYHLGNCKGPCEGLQSPEDYAEGLARLKYLMKGNLGPVKQYYRKQMEEYAAGMEFEKAEHIRKKLQHLESYEARSRVVNSYVGSADVFSILKEGDIAYVNYLKVSEGTVILTQTISLEPKLEESQQEVLEFAIGRLRSTFASDSAEIIVPFPVEYPQPGVTVMVPKGGDRKKLLELSQKNVDYYLEELRRKKMLQLEGKSEKEKTTVLVQLQKDLHLPSLPVHIECFDNSNFQGSFPVAAMVCFKDGLPDKNQYRKFNIRTVEGINDFASMKEIVGRRYKRLKEESAAFPQLIIIDGGKGQLNAAVAAFQELGLTGKSVMVGLAKNEEEIFFPGDRESIKLPWDSVSLKLIRRIRDEVHRFGITFHRNQRSRGTFVNELEQIEGIGKSTAEKLLRHFKSTRKVKDATREELEAVAGPSRALLILRHFHGEDRQDT